MRYLKHAVLLLGHAPVLIFISWHGVPMSYVERKTPTLGRQKSSTDLIRSFNGGRPEKVNHQTINQYDWTSNRRERRARRDMAAVMALL